MDKAAVGLILGAFSALTILLGATAALVAIAFVAGLLLSQHRQPRP